MRLLRTLLVSSCVALLGQTAALAQIDSVILSPAAAQFFPYCSGERPSTVQVIYKAAAGVSFAPDNVFRLEVSDINGNFDGRFGGRFVGTTLKSTSRDTLKAVRLPDNLPFNPGFDISGQGQYRVRLVSSSPAFVSAASAPIAQWQLCPLRMPKMYSSTIRPLKHSYHRGDTLEMTIYRDAATLVIQPGDQLRIQLSDTNGIFRGVGIQTQLIDSVAPAFVGDSMVVRFRLPNTVQNALRYRVRPTLTSDPNTNSSTSNGHDIPVQSEPVSVKADKATVLRIWPQPATDELAWSLPSGAGAVVQASIVSMDGRVRVLPATGNTLRLSGLPAGTYTLHLRTATGSFAGRVVKQ